MKPPRPWSRRVIRGVQERTDEIATAPHTATADSAAQLLGGYVSTTLRWVAGSLVLGAFVPGSIACTEDRSAPRTAIASVAASVERK